MKRRRSADGPCPDGRNQAGRSAVVSVLCLAGLAAAIVGGLTAPSGALPKPGALPGTAEAASLAAPLAGALPNAPGPLLVGRDGTAYRSVLPRDATDRVVARERALIDQRLEEIADEVLWVAAFDLDPLFTTLDGRIAGYAEWAFGWWTTYRLARVGLRSAGGELVAGRPEAAGEALAEAVRDRIRTRFAELVADPETTRARLDAVFRAALEQAAERAAGYALDRAAHLRTMAAPDPGGLVPAAGRRAAPDPGVAALPAESIDTGGGGDALLVRLGKPLVSRLIYSGGVALGTALVLPVGGLSFASGTVLGGVLGIGAGWSLDYGVHRLDEMLSRDGFEAALRQTLQEDRRRIEAALRLSARCAGAATVAAHLPWYSPSGAECG